MNKTRIYVASKRKLNQNPAQQLLQVSTPIYYYSKLSFMHQQKKTPIKMWLIKEITDTIDASFTITYKLAIKKLHATLSC